MSSVQKLLCWSFALVAASAVLFSAAPASADFPASPDGVTYLPVITVYGRPNRPTVVIELTRPSASHEASAAHEDMRAHLFAPPHFLPH